MDLELGVAREELRAQVREVLERPMDRLELWRAFARRGWLDAGALLDAAVVLEEVGRAAAPGPLLAQLETGLALAELGADGRARERAVLVIAQAARVERRGTDWVVSGARRLVDGADAAEVLVVVARDGAWRVESSQPGVRVSALETLDGPIGDVVLESVRAERIETARDLAPALERAQLRAAVLAAAELAGAARAALDHAVAYAKRREQFGVLIGSFQAIQHRLADALIDADAARLAAYDAAARSDAADPEWGLYAALAKLTASEAARRVTASAHQVVGGVGFYEDQGLGRWYRRAKALEARLGGPDAHRERVARALGL